MPSNSKERSLLLRAEADSGHQSVAHRRCPGARKFPQVTRIYGALNGVRGSS